MVSPIESLRERRNIPKSESKRPPVRDKVMPVLGRLEINVQIEPHIERLTEEFMVPKPPRTELGYDSYGFLVSITTPGTPARTREESLFLARQVAPAELWRAVREELKERGINSRTAEIVGSAVRGDRVEDIAFDHGISTPRVYQIIDKFVRSN